MENRPIFDRIARFFKLLYLKLFRIHDTPQRIAIGLGLGVFSGVLPGTGPLAALALAFLFRVNRAAALLGSILTNTWLSIPTFLLSIRAGSFLTGVKYEDIRAQWDLFLKTFEWARLIDVSAYKILWPMLVGYFAVAAFIGFACYVAALIILKRARMSTFVSILALCVFFVLMRRHSLGLPMMRDEGEYAYCAWLLKHDIAPYQHAFLQKPPMIIYTYALAQFIGPTVYWLPKVLDASFVACATACLGLAAQAEFGGAAGLITMWLFTPMVLLPGATQSAAVIEHFMLLPLVAVLAIYALKRERAGAAWYCAAGVCAGIALMYKYTVLPVVLFIFFAWLLDAWRARPDVGALAGRAAAALAGAAAAIAAALGYFASRNALGSVWECTVVFNRFYAGSSVFGGWEAFARQTMVFAQNWWALFILTAAFLALRPARWKFYTGLLILGSVASYGSVYGHYYIVLMPFWAIVCAAALDGLAQRAARKFFVHAGVVRAVFVAAVLVSMHLLTRPPFLASPAELESAKLLRQGYFYEAEDAGARISAMTDDKGYVLVLGYEPQILFYAKRLSPTRFVITYPLLIDTPMRKQYQEEMAREVAAHPPAVIVLARQFYSGEMPLLFVEYMKKVLSSGEYALAGGYVQDAGRIRWKESLGKDDASRSNLLIFRKKI